MDKFQTFLLVAPILLFSVVAHEYAHGYAALKQGDTTAQSLGRLTWNPLKHIDPFLTVILPLVMFLSIGVAFGGAKPVPVDPRNYRDYRRGDIIVSLAGVTVNFILAVLLTLGVIALGLLGRGVPPIAHSLSLVQVMFAYGITINLLLFVFNLIPIPPLDGSHVVKHMLPPAWAVRYERLAGAGFLLLILLVTVGRGALSALLAPVFFLDSIAERVALPFMLASPWTT
ncbi:MAG TPA: site-2 protease family protein [Gemmatimonadaceae bacterium]|nr:site-2 protease family protein [Gemmatimonadaceae bacterium]